MRYVALMAVMSVPWPAAAQYVDLTEPDPVAVELTDVRLSHHTERREAGIVLFAGGALSAIGGAVIAGVGHEDPFWLSFGVGSLGWGAINAALAFAMLDLGDDGYRRIEQDRSLRGDELARARERALRDQHQSATIFAVNFGLDVAYVLSGVLLFFLAEHVIDDSYDQELLRGYSAAQTGQGAFLLVFDLVEWLASNGRADRIGGIAFP